MNFNIKKHKYYIQLEFFSQEILAKSFLRFQEFYENPFFKGKSFTLEDFTQWYLKTNSTFDYYEKWDGFNMPSSSLNDFLKKNKLNQYERDIITHLDLSTDFYLIGNVLGGDSETLNHEICHALFYQIKDYRIEVLEYLDKIKDTKTFLGIKKYILSNPYDESVLLDEVNAYLCETSDFLINDIKLSIDMKIVNDLKNIKNKYIK